MFVDFSREKKMNERGVVVTGVICVISLVLVMILVVNARVTELEEDIKFLRGCIVELDMALEDQEFKAWMESPVEDDPFTALELDDPFKIIN